MMTIEKLAEFMDHYGVIASTMFAVPVNRDELRELVLTTEKLFAVYEAAEKIANQPFDSVDCDSIKWAREALAEFRGAGEK